MPAKNKQKQRGKVPTDPATPLTGHQHDLAAKWWRVVPWAMLKRRRAFAILGREKAADVALDGLIRAAQLYDPRRGLRFSTLAVKCILNRLFWEASKHRDRLGLTFVKLSKSAYAVPDRSDAVEPSSGLEASDAVMDALRFLPDSWRVVVSLRYGLDGHGHHTLEEVARILKVTKERVRQLEAKAIARMRSALSSRRECEG